MKTRTSITNALDSVTKFTYTITEAKGEAEQRVTDLDSYSTGLLKKKTEGNGLRVTETTYDSNGNLDVLSSTDVGDADHLYDAQGNLLEVEIDGVTTEYFYDDRRLLTNTVYASGTSEEISESRTYWDNGLLKQETDARGQVTEYFWTPAYKPAGTVFPNLGTTTNLYDEADRLIASRDAEDNWTTNVLDSVGRPLSVSSVYSVVSNQFAAAGNLTNSIVDPSGLALWTTREFDSLSRLATRHTTLATEAWQYDLLGRATNRIDQASKHWKTEFDALGRPTKRFRPSENYEETGYNALGHRTKFWNADRKPMTLGVDAQGRVTAITNAISKVTSFEYDDRGNLTDRWNGESEHTEYDYDAMNRLTNIVHESTWQASFGYDDSGNLISQAFAGVTASAPATVTFGYDEMNRLTTSTQSVYSVSSVVQNQYDLNGNRTNITYPGGLVVSYAYDEENRLERVSTDYADSTDTFVFGYDGASRMTNIVYPNSVVSTFNYDAESRTTGFAHGSFCEHDIVRDARGFKTTEDIHSGLLPVFTNELRQTRVHNDADQLVSAGDTAYSYDPNGCLTNAVAPNSDSVFYSYDYNNRLKSVGSMTLSTEYIYDASGARIGRIHDSVTNYFVVDYADPLKRLLAETDSAGSVTKYYVWAGFRLLAHVEAGGTVRYYHQDELGSTLALSDSTGSVTDQFAYAPYGKLLNRSGTNETAFAWLGGYGVYDDSATDLHLTLHRAYSADMRRFISADPLGIEAFPNLYAYGDLNPVWFVDPTGLLSRYQARQNEIARLNGQPIPYPDQSHRDRNQNNYIPANKPTLGSDGVYRDGLGNVWIKDDLTPYHGRDEGNEVFRGTGLNSGSEAVYAPNGSIVDSGPDMGTYNRSNPFGEDGSLNYLHDIDDAISHWWQDVLPHEGDSHYTPNLSNIYDDKLRIPK